MAWEFPNRTTSKKKSVSKFLLEFLTRHLPGRSTDLYKNYLHRSWSGYLNLAELAESDPEVVNEFYRHEQPLEDPTFFSIFDPTSLSKLEPLTAKRICVYWDLNNGQVERIYDSTLLDEAFPRGEPPDMVVFILKKLRGNDWSIEGFENPKPQELFGGRSWAELERSLRETRLDSKEKRASGLGKIADGCCVFEEVARCLGYPEWKHSRHLECSTLEELSFRTKTDLRKEFFRDFILVTHLKTKVSGVEPNQRDREFFVLFEALKNPNVSNLDCPVICFGKGRDLYRLEGKQALKVLLTSSSKKSSRSLDSADHTERPVGSSSSSEELSRMEKEKVVSDQSLYKTELSVEDFLNVLNLDDSYHRGIIDEVQRACISTFDVESCNKVFDGDAVKVDFFEKKKSVPIAPQKVQLPVMIGYADIMNTKSKNLPDPPWPRILTSQTFALDSLRLQQNMVAEFMFHVEEQKNKLSIMKRTLLEPFFEKIEEAKKQHVEFFRLKGYLYSDHDPFEILEGNLGKFLDDDDDDDDEEEEEKTSDLEDSDRMAVLKLYKKHEKRNDEGVCKEHELYEGEEENLADFARGAGWLCTLFSDIPGFLKKSVIYRNSLYVVEAWENRLEGRFEKRLKRLADTHLVFGFNAESYDLPILASKMIMSCKRRGINSPIKLSKNGNKISRLSVGSLIFLEGTNLTGSEHRPNGKKAIFPFEELQGPEYLKSACLPSDPSLWRSRSDPEEIPSREDVNKAIALFERRKFKNAGEYMRFHLHEDCQNQLETMLLYHDAYKELLGLSFVDSQKFSVSGLSATGVQTHLMRNKRVGHFFCNDPNMDSVSNVTRLLVFFR